MVLLLALVLAAPRASADETEASSQIAALISAQVTTGKAHGCVRGRFIVEPALPPELKQGVFQEGRVYPAWIRYSNGSGRSQNDAVDDVRGMTVKLMGVPGSKLADEKATQDFLMITGPVFGAARVEPTGEEKFE